MNSTNPNDRVTTPVYIHSTFRDYKGNIAKPYGLQWGMNGDSHITYVIAPTTMTMATNEEQQGNQSSGDDVNLVKKNDPTGKNNVFDDDDTSLRRGIIEAYNRWCCAKDIPYFAKEEDIQSIEWIDENDKNNNISKNTTLHFRVHWNEEQISKRLPNKTIATRNDAALLQLLEQDEAATGTGPPAEVWINGDYICELDGSDIRLDTVKKALRQLPTTATQKNWKRSSSSSPDGSMIRIERYYRGGIRRLPEVFDHIWDNIVALEDPEIVDDHTIIGTATLSDWIMGGNLTSRLWIRDDGEDRILFLRPLRNDKESSSDRRYELIASDDEKTKKISMVRGELARLRYLATLDHPFIPSVKDQAMDPHASRMIEIRANLRRNKKKGKFFGV